MGLDTSFHPVDPSLIERRLLPCPAGRADDDGIDDLIARAAAIRRNRFRAKAWALGVHTETRSPAHPARCGAGSPRGNAGRAAPL